MFQVSRRILPARGDMGSSMRIQILEGEGLHHLFTQHLFPPFKNENNSYGQKYKNNEFSRGCFFTQCFLQPHQQTTVTAEPFLVFSKLPQKRRHKISLTLQPNPPFPSSLSPVATNGIKDTDYLPGKKKKNHQASENNT